MEQKRTDIFDLILESKHGEGRHFGPEEGYDLRRTNALLNQMIRELSAVTPHDPPTTAEMIAKVLLSVKILFVLAVPQKFNSVKEVLNPEEYQVAFSTFDALSHDILARLYDKMANNETASRPASIFADQELNQETVDSMLAAVVMAIQKVKDKLAYNAEADILVSFVEVFLTKMLIDQYGHVIEQRLGAKSVDRLMEEIRRFYSPPQAQETKS